MKPDLNAFCFVLLVLLITTLVHYSEWKKSTRLFSITLMIAPFEIGIKILKHRLCVTFLFKTLNCMYSN